MNETATSRRRGPTDEEVQRATPAAAGGREVRIGTFVILGIAALLTVLFLLTDPATFRGRYMVHTEVADAGGLRRGDPVQMRGVNIGRVHRFDLTPEGVEITLEIEGRWDLPVDSRTRLGAGDILGGRTVEVIPGTAEETIPPGGYLPGTAAVGLFDLVDEMSGEALEVVHRVREILAEPTVGAVRTSVTDLQDLTATLSEMARVQREELDRLTASLNRSAAGLEEGVEEASSAAPDLARAIARADSTLADLRATGEMLQTTVVTLEEILGRVDRGEGTLGQLAVNDTLYQNLNQAAMSIARLAEDVRENPGRYIRFRLF